MCDRTPITGQELEEMKRLYETAPLAINAVRVIETDGTREAVGVTSLSDAQTISRILQNFPRLIAEVERLEGELNAKVAENARIKALLEVEAILMSEDGLDGSFIPDVYPNPHAEKIARALSRLHAEIQSLKSSPPSE